MSRAAVRIIKMSHVSFDKSPRVSKVWFTVKRLDNKDDRVVALREVSIPPAAEVPTVIQILTTTFRLNSSDFIFKIRNHGGCLIPLNSSIPANSKHCKHLLISSGDMCFFITTGLMCLKYPRSFSMVRVESRFVPFDNVFLSCGSRSGQVVMFLFPVRPAPRTIPMTVMNKSMKTRLQTIDRRIQRLEELLPEIKLRRDEKLSQ
ncbi:hypothetical protein F7725_009940, partial [Dissostichus mawsoni]